MKKSVKFLVSFMVMAFALTCIGCDGAEAVSGGSESTTTIGSVDVTAKAYPGVNIITWKAVKDAGSYTVYRTADGEREKCVFDSSGKFAESYTYSDEKDTDYRYSEYNARNLTYYIDTNVKEGTFYKYRIIANPENTIMHNASEKEVTLKTQDSWPAVGTSVLDLEESDTKLSASNIEVELIENINTAKISVTFPVKPYIYYNVRVGQKGEALLGNEGDYDDDDYYDYNYDRYYVKSVGFNYTETATFDIYPYSAGEKEITIVARPFSSLYTNATVTASSTVTVSELSMIGSATKGGVNANWTNYDSATKKATARVRFSPATLDGKEFDTSSYTVYRKVYEKDSSGNGSHSSVTKLGSPKKDVYASSADTTVYYYDDSFDISKLFYVSYYVVLNYKGMVKTASSYYLNVSGDWGNWNYEEDEETSNDIYISSISAETNTSGKSYITVTVYTDFDTNKLTYAAFDSKNEAGTAVASQITTELTLTKDTDYEGYYDEYYEYRYKYTAKSTAALTLADAEKYYVFRLVGGTGTKSTAKTRMYYLDYRNDSYQFVNSYYYD